METRTNHREGFWKRPEGITGLIVLVSLMAGGGYLLLQALPVLIGLAENTLIFAGMIVVMSAVLYMAFDPKVRTLIYYMYRSFMRWLTAWFIDIDPIGILKNYTEELEKNLVKMRRQINRLRGQKHKLKEQIFDNKKDIENNLNLANKAKENEDRSAMILKSRRAGRLKDSNIRLEDLYEKMEALYRILNKMHENSKIMLEDVRDQVRVKEQERKAMRASHTAIESALNIISGDRDKRLKFDRALEEIADDVGEKVGEMERFMKVSENFLESIDLQKGVLEESGLEMLEEWQREGESLLLEDDREDVLSGNKQKSESGASASNTRERKTSYDALFD